MIIQSHGGIVKLIATEPQKHLSLNEVQKKVLKTPQRKEEGEKSSRQKKISLYNHKHKIKA